MMRREDSGVSPLARVVLDVLRVAPGTVDELARETKIPAGGNRPVTDVWRS